MTKAFGQYLSRLRPGVDRRQITPASCREVEYEYRRKRLSTSTRTIRSGFSIET